MERKKYEQLMGKNCDEKSILDYDFNMITAKFFLMLANRMGHSLETMQRVYMHLLPTVQDEVVDILDNL